MVEMRGGGGQGGLNPPPKCARKCANFRNLKANVQILHRKTPPPKWFTLFRLLMLGKICGDVLEVLVRQCRDQMEGGRFSDPDDAFREVTRSCRANNISGERVFAKHDASQHRAPSGKADYHESKVLYSSIKLETGWQNKIVLPRNI